MSMYSHRGMGAVPPSNSARLNELLDQIRAEFDTQLRQTENFEHQSRSLPRLGCSRANPCERPADACPPSFCTSERDAARQRKGLRHGADPHDFEAKVRLSRELTLVGQMASCRLLTWHSLHRYEEEISMLRHQLEAARKGAPPTAIPGPPQHAGPSQQPPSIAPGNGLFSGIMAGGNQAGLAPPQQHPPPQEQQVGPQHQMAQGPPGLPVPPPHPNAQQPPYQQGYPQGPVSNGMGPQPPQSTASPGPGRRGVGRPPNAVGPATPQINTPVPYPGNAQSPQVSHPTPDHARMGGPRQPPVGNALGDLEVDAVAPHNKKTGSDWYAIFNPQVQRVLDVDLVHSLTHESVVCCVRFSHDGKYVATGCNRSAQIFDVQTGEKVCVLEDHNAQDMQADLYIRSVCFSPDGRYLATGAEDKLIRVRRNLPDNPLPFLGNANPDSRL